MMTLALIGLVCWPLCTFTRRSIEASLESRCTANLRLIADALQAYHDKYGHYPPAFIPDATGRPAHSWRVLLTEFLDPAIFYRYDFQEPWDGPGNIGLISKMPAVYACPSRRGSARSSNTCYAVIVGPESAFPPNGTVRLADIADRGLNIPTILVAEIETPEIPWTEPRDLRAGSMAYGPDGLFSTGVRSQDPTGPGLLLTGGQIRRVKPSLNQAVFKGMITISGNECLTECQ
jgi:hypothetical protein